MRRLLILFIVASTLLFPVAAFPQARSFLRGFAEQFTSNPVNWGVAKGRWTYGGGYVYGTPVANNTWSSIAFNPAVYQTLDYTVKLKRAGCLTCSTGVTVRGSGPIASNGTWANGVHFMYSNDGYFVIFKTVGGRITILKNWSPSSRIVNRGWNTIRVTAVRNTYKMYINNTFVTQVIDSSRTNGYVGIQMFSNTVSGNSMQVDWALLTTTVR
jgi:hypothetical protein